MKYPKNIDEMDVEIVDPVEVDPDPSIPHTGTTPHMDRGHIGRGNDNSSYLAHELEVASLPPIDVYDAESVRKRFEEYFEICMRNDKKPTLNGLANSLKVTRTTLQKWGEGSLDNKDKALAEVVRGGLNILASLWEDYMGNAKINPVSGIFLGKNHFQYVDKQELEVAPKNPLGESASQDELRQKYIEAVDIPLLDE